MIQTNIKKQSGFTIVELLIVIVVIGILAAITIVAYNGVQNRANNTKIDTLAKEIADKAEVYAADKDGVYPTLTQLKAAAATDSYKLSAGADTAAVATAPTAGQIQVTNCGTSPNFTGVKVVPYDYTTKTASVVTDKTPRIRSAGASC